MSATVNKRHLRPWVIKWAPLSRVAMLALLPVVPLICAAIVVWREHQSIAAETKNVFLSAIRRWE